MPPLPPRGPSVVAEHVNHVIRCHLLWPGSTESKYSTIVTGYFEHALLNGCGVDGHVCS